MKNGLMGGSETKKHSVSPMKLYRNASNYTPTEQGPLTTLNGGSSNMAGSTYLNSNSFILNGGMLKETPYRKKENNAPCITSRLCPVVQTTTNGTLETDRKENLTSRASTIFPGSTMHMHNPSLSPHRREPGISPTTRLNIVNNNNNNGKMSNEYIESLIRELDYYRSRETKLSERLSFLEGENRQLSGALSQAKREYKENMLALFNENKQLNEQVIQLRSRAKGKLMNTSARGTQTEGTWPDDKNTLEKLQVLNALSLNLDAIESRVAAGWDGGDCPPGETNNSLSNKIEALEHTVKDITLERDHLVQYIAEISRRQPLKQVGYQNGSAAHNFGDSVLHGGHKLSSTVKALQSACKVDKQSNKTIIQGSGSTTAFIPVNNNAGGSHTRRGSGLGGNDMAGNIQYNNSFDMQISPNAANLVQQYRIPTTPTRNFKKES